MYTLFLLQVKKQQEWKTAAERANSEKKILEGKVKDLEKQIRSSPVRADNNNSQGAYLPLVTILVCHIFVTSDIVLTFPIVFLCVGLDASFVQLQQDKESSDKQVN